MGRVSCQSSFPPPVLTDLIPLTSHIPSIDCSSRVQSRQRQVWKTRIHVSSCFLHTTWHWYTFLTFGNGAISLLEIPKFCMVYRTWNAGQRS